MLPANFIPTSTNFLSQGRYRLQGLGHICAYRNRYRRLCAQPPSPLLCSNKLLRSVLLFALILSLVTYRRRRAAQANLIYVQDQQSDGNANRHSWLADAPQLPLQAYGAPPPYTGFAPVCPTVPLPDY